MTKLDMIGETKEDKKIMNAIKENSIRTRELNAKRAKKAKHDKVITTLLNIGLSILACGGMILLWIVISLIENWNF